ncbi:uncharacterized protein N7525_002983 [Penicillium rubens]|uniref:uncharacterized protein n=1 Tax=Penicillium rubens TaxID=1108849 RepID=UPI002A5B0807|nr:uncharacterized protein N7525_002983 [Penicillium rubens]KAJ5837795.1 hypothetical protein N7525_002983 [Penicillium rubens]
MIQESATWEENPKIIASVSRHQGGKVFTRTSPNAVLQALSFTISYRHTEYIVPNGTTQSNAKWRRRKSPCKWTKGAMTSAASEVSASQIDESPEPRPPKHNG